MMAGALGHSQVMGQAAMLLEEAGYVEADEIVASRAVSARVFEDRSSIVGISFFDSWAKLREYWVEVQAVLSERISKYYLGSDAKSWDGYLVLLTSEAGIPVEEAMRIRTDTRRLRKLVATGSELQSIDGVKLTLLPVLPLEHRQLDVGSDPLLARLPEMLVQLGIERALADSALGAFADNRSPMEGIWKWRQSR